MQIVVHKTAAALLARGKEALLAEPACNHGVIQTAAILRGDNHFYEPPFWFCTVESEGAVKGAAIYAEPDGLVLSDMPQKAVPAIYDSLIKTIPMPVRVLARPDLANDFAARLAEKSGAQPSLSTSWYLGRLDKVIVPADMPPGHLRQASVEDSKLVECWGTQYQKEKPSFLNISPYLKKKLLLGDLYVWDSDGPRIILTVSGRTENGVRISSVFGPIENRGFGFASAALATICQSLLDKGHKFILVNWRVGDGVEELYSRLGFRKVSIQTSYLNDGKIR
jgi:hypothetical protein